MKTRNMKSNATNTRKKTLKKYSSKIHGWKIITLRGNAAERGFQHGVLLHEELDLLLKNMPKIIEIEFGTSLDEYLETCRKLVLPNIEKEWIDELNGIIKGALSKGVILSLDFLVGWNSLLSMAPIYDYKNRERCSAFIATGEPTESGNIVMAHNTHCEFLLAPFSNIIMYIYPTKGHAFCMQSGPGFLCSTMDWFITKNGFVGCETTISRFKIKPVFGSPYFCRIRKCMQYAISLDQYVEFMCDNNAGDYACSWLFGNIKSKEILRLELGYEYKSVERTHSGFYWGSNSVFDQNIRNEETDDKNAFNLKSSNGSRNHRLEELLNNYSGKINTTIAKQIIADHYDSYLHKDILSSRTICKHSEKDSHNLTRPPFYPHGAIDGKVIDSNMAKKMEFYARWGSSCGKRNFSVKKYIKTHPRYKKHESLLIDLPNQPWTKITQKN